MNWAGDLPVPDQNALDKATQLRRRFQWLEQFSDTELQEITIRAEGGELEPGKEYFNLSHPEEGIILAPRGKRVPQKAAYVCRDDVPPQVWSKLLTGKIGHMREAS